MIKRGQQVTTAEITNLFTETFRDINALTYDKLKSLSTGCFSGSADSYGELLNVGGQQFLAVQDAYLKEFTDAIEELKSR